MVCGRGLKRRLVLLILKGMWRDLQYPGVGQNNWQPPVGILNSTLPDKCLVPGVSMGLVAKKERTYY